MSTLFSWHLYSQATNDMCAILGDVQLFTYSHITHPFDFASNLQQACCLLTSASSSAWLRKLPTCRQHVAPTAKCRHIFPKCPCRSDTVLIPTHFCVSGFANIHQIFLYSTRGTYGEFLYKFQYVGYGWGSQEILGF